jgi:predicted transcriptional regulator
MGPETIMKTIPLRPDRPAELEEFARQRGKTPADALDEALATYLEWEQQDFEEAVRGIQQGHDDVKAGRTRPSNEFLGYMPKEWHFVLILGAS